MKFPTVAFSPTRLRRALALPVALAMTACASTPPAPTAALQSAQQAISGAERTDAGHYAPGELAEARTKLLAANAAVADKKMVVAARLAEQSQAEAEFASAKTSAVKAGAVNAELAQGNSTLLEEMDRSAGDKQ
jgi:hypothetical protein